MFRTNMREALEHRVEVAASGTLVTQLLQHVYTGAYDPQMEAGPMLDLAHFYGVHDLSVFCAERLVENLTPSTVSELVRKIGRLRTQGDLAERSNPFDCIWERLNRRVVEDPALVRALLESHASADCAARAKRQRLC